MALFKMPDVGGLQESMTMILGEKAEIEKSDALRVDSASFVAEYTNDSGEVVAYCLCDLPLAAGLGAALSMIPPAAAEDMVSEGSLTAIASDNLYEVMNILSALYMNDSTHHLRLDKVVAANDAEIALAGSTQEVSYGVDTGKYGNGKLRFISL